MLPVLLAVVIVVAAGVAARSGSQVWARERAERETEQLLTAAIEVALVLSSLSSADGGTSLDRLEALATGSLREEVTSRRQEVLQVLDDDEVRARAEVIASGVERPVAPRGIFGGPDGAASASLLVATRAEVSNDSSRAVPGSVGAVPGSGGGGSPTDGDDRTTTERTWRWRLEAVLVDGQARVSSAEVAV